MKISAIFDLYRAFKNSGVFHESNILEVSVSKKTRFHQSSETERKAVGFQCELKLTDNVFIIDTTQENQGIAVDIFADKPNSTIA